MLGEIDINSDQVFEMTFLLGHIQPNHGGILLLFFGAIPRTSKLMRSCDWVMPLEHRAQADFLITVSAQDDLTTGELKQFLYALYLAWQLDVQLLLDV